MTKLLVERSVMISAPRQQVWQAITEPEQIVKWFLPALPGAQMACDDAGTLSVLMGAMGMAVASFEQKQAPRTVTSRSLPDRLIATTYVLDDDAAGTRVTVRMGGFESLPANAREDRLAVSGAGWEQALANLAAYLESKELPFPYLATGPLFGFWREGHEWIAVERSVWIHAPRERVWRAITDPEQVTQWFSPGTQWSGSGGLEVGGRMFVLDPETKQEMYGQVIEVVNPPAQFVTRSIPAEGDVPTVTNWMLAEENDGTRLTLTFSGYELMPNDQRQQRMGQDAFGFGMMLLNLKAAVEGTALPFPGGF
ncbi:MAG: SRPBCC family protein [Anaerolineae bacterium]